MPYTADDRRGADPGRRDYDGVCMLHDPTLATCQRDKDATGKKLESIEERLDDIARQLFTKIDGAVSWKVFAFIALLAVSIAGAGFGYFGTSLSKLSENVIDLKVITHSLVYRVDQLEKKIPVQPAQ